MAGNASEGLIATISTTSGKLFNANPGRTYLSITNTHASAKLYVRFGDTAATAALGIYIAPGTTFTLGDNTTRAVAGNAVQCIADGSCTIYAYEHSGNLVA